MTEACPNCGKPLLPTDTVCWHCGHTLPKRKGKLPEALNLPPPKARARNGAETGPLEYDLRALAIYGLLTLAIVLALWLVMNALGRRPVLVRSAGPNSTADWVTVTDADLRYTLSLPPDWQWLDVAYRDQSALLGELIARQPYIDQALRPLGDAAGDVEILAVAVGAANLEDLTPAPLVVVGRSARLRDLDTQGALNLLAQQTLPATETVVDTRLAGQPQARFSVLDAARAYQCRELFVTGAGAGYLAAACAPRSSYGALRPDLNEILDSFQLIQN